MNDTERGLLTEVMRIADEVPKPRMSFPAEAIGSILAYQEDIDQVLWTVGKVCEGMCLSGCEGLEEPWDYLAPDKIVKAFDAWLSSRKDEGWKRGARTVESFYEFPDD